MRKEANVGTMRQHEDVREKEELLGVCGYIKTLSYSAL
jgi:hypothetical protein